jgi:hypothetical protein
VEVERKKNRKYARKSGFNTKKEKINVRKIEEEEE